MTARDNVKEYYADLLILQYHSKPKARATIKLWCDIFTGDDLLYQFEDILDIDTAIGAQLDIIGKILDCPRTVTGLTFDKEYFSFEKINALGFSDKKEVSNGIFKTYYNSTLNKYALLDEDYRILLKFKSVINVLRGSMQEMDDILYQNFDSKVVLENNQDLTINFIISTLYNVPLRAALKLGYLRPPIGVGMSYLLVTPDPLKIFGFNKKVLGNAIGFSDKRTLREGTFLTKENMIKLN